MGSSIRYYKENDIKEIEKLGINLHKKYKFNLDQFSKCIVYEENNNIIGFITYSIIYERAELIDIYVKEKYRNNSVGTKLLNAFIKDAFSSGCDNITLEVGSKNNVAIKFYKKNGFNIVSTRKNYYNDSDGYLMKKDLR